MVVTTFEILVGSPVFNYFFTLVFVIGALSWAFAALMRLVWR
jgi:hypothetical protein